MKQQPTEGFVLSEAAQRRVRDSVLNPFKAQCDAFPRALASVSARCSPRRIIRLLLCATGAFLMGGALGLMFLTGSRTPRQGVTAPAMAASPFVTLSADSASHVSVATLFGMEENGGAAKEPNLHPIVSGVEASPVPVTAVAHPPESESRGPVAIAAEPPAITSGAHNPRPLEQASGERAIHVEPGDSSSITQFAGERTLPSPGTEQPDLKAGASHDLEPVSSPESPPTPGAMSPRAEAPPAERAPDTQAATPVTAAMERRDGLPLLPPPPGSEGSSAGQTTPMSATFRVAPAFKLPLVPKPPGT
jgi:hypothetical protein